MYFGSFQYLYFLPLIVLPLIIYLIFRKKPEKLVFSSLFLLKFIAKNINRRTKIKDILLLIIRTLLLLFLIFLFAKPFIGDYKDFDPGKKTTAMIYIDSSPSMADKFSGNNKFDSAKNLLIKSIDKAPSKTEFYLMTSDPDEKFNGNKKDALKFLNSLEIYGRERSLDEIITQSDSILSDIENSNKILLVLTDGKVKFDKANNFSDDYFKKAVIFQTDADKSDDISIDSVRIINRNFVFIKLSSESKKNTRLDIFQDGRKIHSVKAAFEDDFSKVLKIELEEMTNSEVSISAKINDESNPLNDSYNFVLPKLDKKKILLVGDNKSFCIRRLLSLLKTGSDSIFTQKIISPAKINSVKFSDYDLIFFDEMSHLSSFTVSGLKNHLNESRSVYFTANDKLNLNDYNSNLVSILGFPNISGYEKLSGSFAGIKIKDLQHPIFKGVFGENFSNIGSVEISNYYKVLPNIWTSLIDVRDSPLLLERTFGKGKIFFLTTGLDQQSSNIIENGIAIPVLLNSFYYLISGEIESESAKTVGDAVESENNFYLVKPGDNYNPGHDEISKRFSLKKPGFYKMYSTDGIYIKQLAVNCERENYENRTDEIGKTFKTSILKTETGGELDLISSESKDMTDYLLLMILLLICAEIFLVRIL
ncbi:MAG: VWA domain-containing protein [Candidatus Delongbacteria bacterium]|nr:VWA domain-containing protein [Candidatus Delongbacteria bacterium]MCG2760147.1 VWA domain-containing protein [Candidatus Delongbacteria bacterium]